MTDLIEAHIPKALQIAGMVLRMYRRSDPDTVKEYEAEALAGLCAAAADYRPDRGASFWTYAAFRVKGAVQDYARSTRSGLGSYSRRTRSRTEVVYDEALPELPTVFVDAGAEGRLHARILAEEVCARLPAFERWILARRYGDDWSEKTIGEELGVTESRVCQIEKEALARLQTLVRDRDQRPADALRYRREEGPGVFRPPPPEVTRERQEQFLALLAAGHPVKAAPRLARVSEHTLQAWKKDPAFSKRYRKLTKGAGLRTRQTASAKKLFLARLETGQTVADAARAIGVRPNTAQQWFYRDPAFAVRAKEVMGGR